METLLNRGLSFTVLPLKLDLTEVLVDFKRFERSAIWHEFMYGKEKDDNYPKQGHPHHNILCNIYCFI